MQVSSPSYLLHYHQHEISYRCNCRDDRFIMQWCEDLNLRNPTNVRGMEKARESGGKMLGIYLWVIKSKILSGLSSGKVSAMELC
jgi:hypothetical protein